MSETQTFVIYGASDDLIETEGIPGCDEFGAWVPGPAVNASFILAGPDGQMRLIALYGPAKTGCWAIAPMQVDEGAPFPDWPIRITHQCIRDEIGYSTRIEIDVPVGTRLIKEGV